MTIKITPNKKTILDQAPSDTKFTLQQIEDLFNIDDWGEYYDNNIHKFRKADVYEWPVFPLLKMEGRFHRCILHPTINVDAGNKTYTHFWKNIHFSEFVSHCIFYEPEQHKKYIIDKLLIQ